ncbi:HEPN domain-containing protein [Roseibacillus ishigakijimensis]|uniref:RiboL-PSP-HEPN domain-containing protein n=1 Tax=Roseibacillus ishigakijimensis TaxID=454146 RepID=A0A934VNE3_9BACT|nr:HEPN domain-containing protein [Roseibacillus ishigakijimensis]MBK1835021.1 hypothetical protein [Roseibacillus ishigakijimensis]
MMQSISSSSLVKYKELFESLRNVIDVSEQRVISDEPDVLIVENVNFFTKSYLVSICSYLEAFLQDVALEYSKQISGRVLSARIPHNFIHWRLATKLKNNQLNYDVISLPVAKKDVADEISANPYRTLKLFQLLGVDLSGKDAFESNKDLVCSIVSKRNNIIHHNDAAADVSFGDLKDYINVISHYMVAISEAVDEAIT